MTPDEFRSLAHAAADFIADYWERVHEQPVLSAVKPGEILAGLPLHPPANGDDLSGIFADLQRVIMPGITHWQSPHFFGFFPANGSFPALLGDMLSTGLGVQGMLWATSPACTELEVRVLDWLGGPDMLALDPAFASSSPDGLGMIHGTASEAALVALVAARARLRNAGVSDERMVMYTSEQSHSSIMKAAMIAGLATSPTDHSRVRLVRVNDRMEMRPEALRDMITSDVANGLAPMFVCATVGTTGSTAIDPVAKIAAVIRETCPADACWLHVDAAFSGCACICPEFRWQFAGVEHADTIVLNPHKWLLTSFDCSCMFTRRRSAIRDALSITPEYLRNAASQSGQVIDYRDYQIPLGRRFRSLKLWLVIRHYGVDGLRAYIREHVRIAEIFESLVRSDDRFEITAPRTTALVCFRLRPIPGQTSEQTDTRNRSLLDALNRTGKLYLTHTALPTIGPDGHAGPTRLTLRMAIGATQTRESHVRSAWTQIRALADEYA